MRVCGVLVGAVFCVAGADAAVLNGDFEGGNTGFTSDYSFRTVSDGSNIFQYGVTHSSFEWSQFWNTIGGDHTTGTGLFLIADSGSPASAAIWRQTVAVTPGTDYTFSAWIANWTSFASASLNIAVDGASIGTFSAPTSSAWSLRSLSWNSGASTSVTLSINPTSFFQPGDDVAIDDIALTAIPAPGAGAVLVLGAARLLRRRR